MDIDNGAGPDRGPLDDILRLQAEYSARLTQDTLTYLRSLQAALSPRSPGTVVASDGRRLVGKAEPGGEVDLSVGVENRQRVHATISPALSPLLGDDGTTWYPEVAFVPDAALIAPDGSLTLHCQVTVPEELPPGGYRGSLLLHGFVADGIPVEIGVGEDVDDATGVPPEPEAQP
jgi:hypothetical protein